MNYHTIEYVLRDLAVDRDEKGVDKLPYIEFAINLSVADSMGKMPFELCYRLNIWTVTNH